ncbi:hypothetical protein MHOL44478_19350 [Mycobacterium holsaticum DSM 44478]|nr:hypothetical protein [Mycolicibacterium holsaticum DSM 44478 = JCM 12374]
MAAGVVDEPADRVANMGIPTGGTSAQVEIDAFRPTNRIAMLVETAHCEVPVIEIHSNYRAFGADFTV